VRAPGARGCAWDSSDSTSGSTYLASARERVELGGMLYANVDGFDLHGRIAFGAKQRERLEELVRYCARPALANDRLEKRADGRYRPRLKTRWRDGTTHLLFEPIELMERLAAQIPKPRVNQQALAGAEVVALSRSRVIAPSNPSGRATARPLAGACQSKVEMSGSRPK
jgi:hypothetical protein